MLNLFVSDLHLSPRRPETSEVFERFLAGPARQARAVFILGDLFDYWVGDDDLAAPFNGRICRALAALTASGVATHFLPGNRDFLVGGDFTHSTRMNLLPDPSVLEIAGRRTLLLHGDTLCTDDTDYQAFRATVRGPAWSQAFLALPLTVRRAEIEALREQSEAEKEIKAGALMDANAAAVAAAFGDHGVTRMIHGHTHRQARHTHLIAGQECERWVLGDWGTAGNALAVDEAGCRWLTLR